MANIQKIGRLTKKIKALEAQLSKFKLKSGDKALLEVTVIQDRGDGVAAVELPFACPTGSSVEAPVKMLMFS